jgi:hypothetical protein
MSENTMTRGFKRKTIEKIISNKMKYWIASLKEESEGTIGTIDGLTTLQKEVKDNYIVTGGAIASMLMGQLPNDFDVYFTNTDTAKKVADFYLKKHVKTDNSKISKIVSTVEGSQVKICIKSAGVYTDSTDLDQYDYFESLSAADIEKYFEVKKKTTPEPYSVSYITSNAISLHGDVQIILRFTGSANEIHKNYDFVHTTNYFTEKDGLVLNEKALEAIMAKELKYVGSLYPICSVFRLRKFISRGWTITAGEIFKICYDISKLDLDNINVLQDQLIGVDSAYFSEVISVLKAQSSNTIDRTYIFDIINRIFDEALDDYIPNEG